MNEGRAVAGCSTQRRHPKKDNRGNKHLEKEKLDTIVVPRLVTEKLVEGKLIRIGWLNCGVY